LPFNGPSQIDLKEVFTFHDEEDDWNSTGPTEPEPGISEKEELAENMRLLLRVLTRQESLLSCSVGLGCGTSSLS
jgi:hypothetical protein